MPAKNWIYSWTSQCCYETINASMSFLC